MTKSALVTGGSGYFGELLVKKLINKDYQVSIFDIVKNSDLSSDINFLQGDIRELDLVERACEDIDIVFHCVAQVPVAKSKHLFETKTCFTEEQNILSCKAPLTLFFNSNKIFLSLVNL